MKVIVFIIAFELALPSLSLTAQIVQKNRVIVLSDIEAEPDDIESFVHLVLYSICLT